ncbi:hypothetical protein CASFOL_037279 [Castilleja foliolosa]|uniref:glucose-6-phosphate 1-epimerase n=1 Tax=Castilleja foliolosa TaxID=1961234 RepID=A0ABD3BPK8_9LAMI
MMALSAALSFSLSNSAARARRFSGVAMASASANVENVKVTKGLGDLPKVILTSAHGSEAELYLYGGCVTSWKVAGKDLLFVRPDAVFTGQKPISGGIPHCFPQFGPGPIQQHGFARNLNWSIASSENVDGNPTITLELKDGTYSRTMWDYSFQALYKVTLDKNTLLTELKVTNTDAKQFSFNTALHTYFSALASGASVRGLKGSKTLNKDPDPKNPVEGKEERDAVTFPGFVDCIYLDAPGEIQLDNGLGDVITIKNTNWSDAVLWNPHLTMKSCYKDFVCVENAKIGQVQLEPAESWIAVQKLSVG